MTLWQPDAIAEITFLATAAGGRSTALPIGTWFGCPLCVSNEYFDVRLDLSRQQDTIQPGDSVRLPIKFMNANLALPSLSPGIEFTLWEGKIIATGKIVDIVSGANVL